MPTITSANSVFFLSVGIVFPIPQKIQGFAVDDAFGIDPVEPAEVRMGVDGHMSAGFVYVPVRMQISLQADSPSIPLFEFWYAAQKAQVDVYYANGVIRQPSINKSYTLTNGILTSYAPIADSKRVLDPQRYAITWESIIGAPI